MTPAPSNNPAEDLLPVCQRHPPIIRYLNTQDSEYLPSSQHMQDVEQIISEHLESTSPHTPSSPIQKPKRSAEYVVHYGSSWPHAPEESTSSTDQDLKRRRVIITKVEPGPINTQGSHDHFPHMPRPTPTPGQSDSVSDTLPQEKNFSDEQKSALIAWFHHVIWKHSLKDVKSPTWVPFEDYLKKHFAIETYNPYLVDWTLEQRRTQYDALWQQFMVSEQCKNNGEWPLVKTKKLTLN
jgi:hypothetical protein